MELRDFAEQVLFATNLADKLRCPDSLTDEKPGSPLVVPAAPGRPAELTFKPQGSGKADFPSARRLEKPEERGRLLHFFANHELLATELMALVLLRFPEAPHAFRRGVLQTLKDEQRHTGLYLQRMRECGIQFGDLPVSGYFWRAVSPMQSPLDYVASLSLTFEQANLDFCRHFARDFHAVGDDATTRLLETIYLDEIGHVAYGLKWFRRWKMPGESDWEAFCKHLKFPLSPSRAKGLSLNVEGRRAAGFDPSFIAELNIFSQSKGRTPTVFVFNPFVEGYIASGKSFTPVKSQQLLAKDLENLPQFLCRQDDVVLVARHPSVQLLSSLREAGFPLPEFVEMAALSKRTVFKSPPSSIRQRKLGALRPWAWGPDSLELLQSFFCQVTDDKRKPQECFNDRIAQLYSKAWSAALLQRFLTSNRGDQVLTDEPWLCSSDEVGVAVDTPDGALEAIATIRDRGHHQVVVKEVLGLAGHNAIRLWEPDLLPSQQRWLARALQNGRQVIVEPWLEREIDFSVQLEMGRDSLKLCGYTGLRNDPKGQYLGNWAEAHYARRLPSAVSRVLSQSKARPDEVHQLYAAIFRLLESELTAVEYRGPISIDAFVYRTPQGNCRLKPVVEINPRYTMGRLTLELMKHACPGSSGLFRLINSSTARSEGFDDLAACGRSLQTRFPLKLEGQPKPKIREGFLCLNDPAQARVCLATFQVNRTPPT